LQNMPTFCIMVKLLSYSYYLIFIYVKFKNNDEYKLIIQSLNTCETNFDV
jgi:hypothetical protein